MSLNNAYFDYAASTPLDPKVLAAMSEMSLKPGNPSSVHSAGREMRSMVDDARRQVADFLSANPREVVFTSGATEANNLAVIGWWQAVRLELLSGVRPRVLTSALEHPSVLQALARLQADGAQVEMVPVSKDGLIDLEALATALGDDVVFLSVPWVNNIFGTRQPVEAVGALVRAVRERRGAGGRPLVWLCDAVQAARFERLDPETVGVDMLSLSGHKLYGPKGVGCLWRGRLSLEPVIRGGGQEDGLRSGTENVAGIVGFGKAASLMTEHLAEDQKRDLANRRLIGDFLEKSSFRTVVPAEATVSGTVFLRHSRETGENLALKLDVSGLDVATGSACTSGDRQAPALLTGLIGAGQAARGGIRISWGRFTTDAEMDRLIGVLAGFR